MLYSGALFCPDKEGGEHNAHTHTHTYTPSCSTHTNGWIMVESIERKSVYACVSCIIYKYILLCICARTSPPALRATILICSMEARYWRSVCVSVSTSVCGSIGPTPVPALSTWKLKANKTRGCRAAAADIEKNTKQMRQDQSTVPAGRNQRAGGGGKGHHTTHGAEMYYNVIYRNGGADMQSIDW